MTSLGGKLRWFGTICSVSLLVLWLSSGGYWVYLTDGNRVTLYISGGVATATVHPAPGIKATFFACGRKHYAMFPEHLPSWRPFRLWQHQQAKWWQGSQDVTQVPLTVVTGVFLLPTLSCWVWALRRRIPPGHCRACSYDLTGNTSGTCPECGTAIEPIRRADAV